MRVFVTGATGALGRHLVPMLVAAGYEVTATTRTPGKVAQLRQMGAVPVVLDGLDGEAVMAAVRAAAPEVIVHEMTALAGMKSLRNPDKLFAVTNELRTRGTDNLLAAAERAGTRRVIAQSNGRRERAYRRPGEDRGGSARRAAGPDGGQGDGGDQVRGGNRAGRGAGGDRAALRQLLRAGYLGCPAGGWYGSGSCR